MKKKKKIHKTKYTESAAEHRYKQIIEGLENLTNNYQNLQYLAGERLADVAKYMKENETLRSENNKLKLLLADRELAKNFNEEKK